MSGSIKALSESLIYRFLNDSDLNGLIPFNVNSLEEKEVRIYDYIPKEAVSPYIVIGEPIITDVKVTPQEVLDLRVTFHVWNNAQENGMYGNALVSQCLQAVKKALKYKVYPDGYEVINVRKNQEQIFDDINDHVKHGVFSLTYTLIEKQ